MKYESVAALAAVGGLIVLSRSAYRLLGPDRIDADGYFHLYVVDEIRNNGHRLPRSPEQVTTRGEYAYPYFMHWVLSFFSRRTVQSIERFFSPLSDVALYAVVLLLLPFGAVAPEGMLVGAILLLLTPQLMQPDQAHGIGISARKPGLVLTTACLLLLTRFATTGSEFALGASVVLSSLVFLTSKFSLQALTFLVVPIGVFVEPLALLVLPVGFFGAVLMTGGRYLTVFRTHLSHLRDYAVRKQYQRFEHSVGTPVTLFRDVWQADSWLDGLHAVFESRRTFPLACNPLPIAAVAALGAALVSGVDLGVPDVYLVWLLSGAVTFVLISMPHLLFLGEPERYLEYTYVPSVVVVAAGVETLGAYYSGFVGSLALLAVAIVAGFVWSFERRLYEPERSAAIESLASYLSRKDPGVVVVQPSTVARNLVWKTDHSFVETLGNQASTPAAVEEYDRLFPEGHALVTDDLDWLEAEYDPDWAVFDLRWIDRTETPGSLSRPDSDPCFDNDQFEVYDFDVLRETMH